MADAPGAGEGRRRSGLARLTSGQWLALTAGAFLIAALAGLLLTFTALHRLAGARTQVVDRIDPARVAAAQMLAGMLDQETAVRGFALAQQEDFLVPLREGQAAAARARAGVARIAAGGRVRELLEDLRAVDVAAADWRTGYADPVVAAVRGNRAPGSRAQQAAVPTPEEGRARFERVRGALATLDRHLATIRVRERARLHEAARAATAAAIASGVLLLAAAAMAGVTVRRVINTPLRRLSRDVRSVARGDFTRPVLVAGPRDIEGLSADVESMRERIVAELEAVTEARAAVEAQSADLQRSNAELEQFAYVASHDLQEPLRKVATFCGMLQHRYQGQLDDRADQYIEFAVDGAKRMQVLINDLLAFSRVGRQAQDHRRLSMEDVVADAVGNLATAIEESGATVTVQGPLPEVVGDRSLLTALVQNLVGNGIKFRGPEPPQVRISVREERTDADGQPVFRFAVDDNGIGIAPRYADRIFIIFQRLHPKEEYSGTGIGLAMCRKIAEFHGGHIWLEADGADGGASFAFTLPVPEPEEIA
jgi:signal transduction histidine kinase